MLTSKWRVRSHRHFGTILVPTVELEIGSSSGRYHPFSLCIDSGAIISLLPRSAADVLGLDSERGRLIELSGVGRQHIIVHLHELNVRIPTLAEISVPFAVAVDDNVPALLGRIGIFDRFEIAFDPVLRETRLHQPKCDDNPTPLT